MGDRSAIEWTDATWNPTVGCTVVSEGCRNCYAARESIRLAGHPNAKVRELYAGLAEHRGVGDRRRAVFTGKVQLAEDRLDQPLRWQKPRLVFVDSMSDLFHPDVPDAYLDRVWGVMAVARRHTFQVLTKRPERARDYLDGDPVELGTRMCEAAYHVLGGKDPGPAPSWPLPNVWLGTSVEDQAAAEERIPQLLAADAAVRFLSCEPLLGPVQLRQSWKDYLEGWDTEPVHACGGDPEVCSYRCPEPQQVQTQRVDWVIAGGESGPGARPMHPDWARSLRDQCLGAGVPFLFKQWGAWVTEDQSPLDITLPGESLEAWPGDATDVYRVGKKAAGRELDGRTWDEMPDPVAVA